MDQLERVVVVGGSIAGLAAAAALSSRAREVVVVERRTAMGGVVAPQGHLPHIMLASGADILEELYPGFSAGLLAEGAYDGGRTRNLPGYWAAAGGVRDHIRFAALPEVPRAIASRGLIERRLRAATMSQPEIRVVRGNVEGLRVEGAADSRGRTVTGVRLGTGDLLDADLVVDAGGRGSRMSTWLRAAGYPAPRTSEVVVDLRYSSFVVERKPDDFDGGAFAIVQNTPDNPRIGVALAMEDNCWQVVLGGYFGLSAPTDIEGATAFARGLADPVLAELVSRPRLSEPARYSFRSSMRRHWDRVDLPARVCSIGDAVASFNPIYGQGMAAALLQVNAMRSAIDRYGADQAHSLARAVARTADAPWLSATGGDFVYAATVGHRPPGAAVVTRYLDRVMRAAAVDELVNTAFTEVQQLSAPPASLFRPTVVARSLARGRAHARSTGRPAAVPAQSA